MNIFLRVFLICTSAMGMFLVISCYSFTGNTLTSEMKTVEVRTFPNNAAFVNPELSQNFSIDLRNRFLQRTTLKGTTVNPDLLIDGEITNYQITPTSITAGVESPGGVIQAAQNKLSISVRVRYENKINPTLNFERTYTDEVVFSSDLDAASIETTQVKIVNERLINRIFNDIVANW